jgi:imidazolonepropionase-like amidohydrolase
MRAPSRLIALGAILALPCFAATADNAMKPHNAPTTIAFLHVNVIPMNGERVLRDQTVVVRGGRLAQIGSSKRIHVGKSVRVIDAQGKFLLPGLVDAHVHLQSQTEFPLYLANGVTTVFNLDGRRAHLLWRNQIANGETLGPTIFSTGPIFHQKRSAEEDVRLVDEQAAAGYDGIKVYNEVSKEEYPALIAEANKKNLLLMGHVARGPGFGMTLRSGQSIAHLEEIVYTNFNPKNDDDFDHLVFDESQIPGLARETKRGHIYVTPTLNNFALIVQQATDLDTFLKNPHLQYVAPWTLENFEPANNRYKNRFGEPQYAVLRNLLAIQRKLLRALNDQGVPLMAGTDATEVGPIAGFGLHQELKEFVQDGLTPYEALQTATTNPARYLRQSSEFGTIEAGKRADLVLLVGNPLNDISNTQNIAGVMVRGHWLDARELSSRMNEVPGEYRHEQQKIESLLQHDPGQAATYLTAHDPLGRLTAFCLTEVASKESAGDLVKTLHAIGGANASPDIVSEDNINALGYALMNKGLYPQAIAVLTTNTESFPKSANTWDSLADALVHSGDIKRAVQNYQNALVTDSTYGNADFAKKFIAQHPQK